MASANGPAAAKTTFTTDAFTTDKERLLAAIDACLATLGRSFCQNFKSAIRLPLAWLLLGITFGILACSSVMFGIREHGKQQAYRQDVHDIAKKNADVIQAQLIRSVSATYALGAFIQSDDRNVTRDSFGQIAHVLLDTYGGITNLQFQPFGVLNQIYPLAGSEGAIGHALFVDPNRVASATNTASSGKLTFMGPIKLIQGGTGIIARYPIYTTYSPQYIPEIKTWWPEWSHGCCEDMEMPAGVSFPGPLVNGTPTHFWGFAGMLTLVDKLVEDLHLEDLEGKYKYQLVDKTPSGSIHSSGVFVYSPDAPPDAQLEEPVVASVSFSEAGVEWEFRLEPKEGWPAVSGDFIIQIAMLVIGAALSTISRIMNLAIKYAQNLASKQLVEMRELITKMSPPDDGIKRRLVV